ncbi:MAG TPA: RNA-binding protein [bacterium]|nr:RNA-binding protein [bacterium]
MSKRIYVGNLAFSTTESELRELFEQFGQVDSVNVVSDRQTGRSRGFAFVEMESEAADASIRELDGKDFGGRNLKVNEAKPREDDRRGGGGGGGRRFGGGGGGGARRNRF